MKLKEVPSNNPNWFHYEVFDAETNIGKIETQIDYYPDYESGKQVLTIYKLFVNPKFRKQGYGSLILLEAETLCREKELETILCLVRPLDEDITEEYLKKFYSKNGFRFDERDDSLYALKGIKN